VDEDIPFPVATTCLDHEDFVGWIGAQTIGERTARRAATDDDVVIHPCSLPAWRLPTVPKASSNPNFT
jgi:hypothetical protein